MEKDLNAEVLLAKEDEARLNTLVEEQKRFIKVTAFKTIKRFVSESDDIYDVALIAFYEAVRTYDKTKGDFKPFAAVVIRRRILDELRRDKNEIPVAPTGFEKNYDEENQDANVATVNIKMTELSKCADEDEKRRQAILDEIEEAGQILSKYGFSFFELAECSPKSMATKEACKDAIICLLRPGELYEEMKRTKKLPMKEVEEKTGIKRKTLERHRKYIMAVAELLHGDFPHLNEYLTEIRRGLVE